MIPAPQQAPKEYDPIFVGLLNYFQEMRWQRVEDEISIAELIEILTDFAKMEAEEKAPHTTPASHQRIEQVIKEINDLLPVWHYYSPPTTEISFEKVKKIRSKLALLRGEQQ